MIEKPISSYLEAAAARSPAPGGGSVSALGGALGASMVSMVCNFTVGKKKHEDVQEEVKQMLAESEKLRLRLAELVDEDIKAYSSVSSAYSLAQETDEQRKVRADQIEKALKQAVGVPLEVATCCFRVLELARRLVEIGDNNLISDVGVAVLLAEAALRGANLNVEINLVSIEDASFVKEKRLVMKPFLEKSRPIVDEVTVKVMRGITKS